ncbi:hypothetical protein M0534_00785 [Methylonatrum kenyense]|uniref:hypothetical protein n=1 Tax=Methylonatrum kenyense TaxID=455253 RepID=UPI0020C12142|nr:hypothetical protein [Methylonatrum kenyense]MCK8514868.1 hypothetical protein [Methylonatrum kenyense]
MDSTSRSWPKAMLALVLVAGVLVAPLAQAEAYPDWQGAPLYGTLNAHADESDWLAMLPVRAGGGMAMPEAAGEDCQGYVEQAQPDLDLNLRTEELRDLVIRLATREPLLIVVYSSEREWVCSSLAASGARSQLSLVLDDVSPGSFNIWIGHRDSDGDYPRADMTVEFRRGEEGVEL